MGELGALFNPGMRHELEERQAKAARREEEGNARDGDLRIDLDSGVAVINVPGGQDRQPGNDTEAAGEGAGGAETARVGDGAPTPRSTPAAAAEPVVANGQDEATGEAGTTPGTPAAEPAAPLRPRGKRGMASAR